MQLLRTVLVVGKLLFKAAYQTDEARRIFVVLARNATGGSASIKADKMDPPKQ